MHNKPVGCGASGVYASGPACEEEEEEEEEDVCDKTLSFFIGSCHTLALKDCNSRITRLFLFFRCFTFIETDIFLCLFVRMRTPIAVTASSLVTSCLLSLKLCTAFSGV